MHGWQELRMFRTISLALAILVFHVSLTRASTWSGSVDMNWFNSANWIGGIPGSGDSVVADASAARDILLTNSTPALASFFISGRTITFSNWNTTLTASDVTVQNGGIVTLPPAFTESQMSNRVHVVCANFNLQAGGTIDADSKGYAGAGPGLGAYFGAGGYGGKGGTYVDPDWSIATGGEPCGSANAPTQPGSGGGQGFNPASAGGGAIHIEASGNATINGTISANGGYANNSCGSGGSIYITCGGVFSGSSSGMLRVNGGSNTAGYPGGGGGRIAVNYGSVAADNKVRFSAAAGTGGWIGKVLSDTPVDGDWSRLMAGMGTVSFPNAAMLSPVLADQFSKVRIIIPGFNSWSVSSLTLSNTVVCLGESGFTLNVANNLNITTGSELMIGGQALRPGYSRVATGVTAPVTATVQGSVNLDGGSLTLGGLKQGPATTLAVGQNMTLNSGGSLTVFSGSSTPTSTNGALVAVTGNLSIATSSWILPHSNPTNGGSALFQLGSLLIATNGGFNADGKGYQGRIHSLASCYGPGAGESGPGNGAGGGYGGKGGDYLYAGGTNWGGWAYGSSNAPIQPGSGGGGGSRFNGSSGGGLIWLQVDGGVTLDGKLTANSTKVVIFNANSSGGTGSGGGVFLCCLGRLLGGSQAVIQANGANSDLSGGGGGRISIVTGFSQAHMNTIISGGVVVGASRVESLLPNFAGAISVTGGVGGGGAGSGANGSVVMLKRPYNAGTFLVIR